METRPALNFFDISSKTGFLPESPPLTALPSVFNDWNEVFSQLSDLLRKHKLRDAVHRLPEFHEQHLCTKEEWRAALILLSGLFQGYLWQDDEKGLPTKMPAVLSVPFVKVSKQIGTPPVGNYASTVLYNWRLRDPRKEMSLENLQAIVNHTGTEDESWFFMVHVVIELEAVPAVEAIWEGLYTGIDFLFPSQSPETFKMVSDARIKPFWAMIMLQTNFWYKKVHSFKNKRLYNKPDKLNIITLQVKSKINVHQIRTYSIKISLRIVKHIAQYEFRFF